MAFRNSKTWDAWGILNHQGEPWTSRTFENEDEAHSYLLLVQKENPTWDLRLHRVVKVRTTVRVPKKAA